jgi:hypothetical protein
MTVKEDSLIIEQERITCNMKGRISIPLIKRTVNSGHAKTSVIADSSFQHFGISTLFHAIFLLILAIIWLPKVISAAELTSKELEFFEAKIRPILAESCYECHNSVDKKKGDLALDWRGGILESKIVMPGDPANSPLIKAILHDEDYEPMPSKAPKLANLIIKNFEEWIQMGAPDPRTKKPTKEELAKQVDWESIRLRRQSWWAFQPLQKKMIPRADDTEWDNGVVDRAVFAGMRKQRLVPQKIASPDVLVRRLHLILTGLPPKPEVVKEFVNDPSIEAYEQIVDSLMVSPHYGERWARYWMDWYRYAESHGSEGDPTIPYASQYRNYLIRAINADVPYDQMVREHLAGDLLNKPRLNEKLGLNESAIGSAHLRMVPHGFGVTDAYDEQITFTDNQVDVVSKAMLGLTVSCARCHNHKFDPISQKDYYKFFGIMIGSRPATVNVDTPILQNLHRKELTALKIGIRRSFADYWLEQVDGAIDKLEYAKFEKPSETDPLAAWATLRDLDSKLLIKQFRGLERKYTIGLANNEKAKAAATFYADLRNARTYAEWFKIGNGLDGGPSPSGVFAVAGEGPKAISGIYPAGVYTHIISDKHSATLNSVFHLAKGSKAQIRGIGSNAQSRFVMRSYPLSQGLLHPTMKMPSSLGWVGWRKYPYWNGEKGYFQINTGPDSTHQADGGRSWFGVLEVYAGEDGMRELGAPIVALPRGTSDISDRASLLAFYRKSLAGALVAWQKGEITDAQAILLDAFVSREFLPHKVASLPEKLRAQVNTYRSLENAIRIPQRAPGVMEGEPWDQPLLNRGDHKKEGVPVERGFLEMFGGEPYSKSESGRRELAEDILKEHNPLTSRVIVNRLWNHVFGRGIVGSSDNFGRLGKEPTHPALLDHLAIDFKAGNWRMKPLVKQLVMSRTFRSASIAPVVNAERDTENLYLAHFPARRLDAEAILDVINHLATGSGKRAVYRKVQRNSLDPFLSTFNFPVPTSTVGDRDLTNVPAQALTLMNGKEVMQAAQKWSKRIMRDHQTPEARVEQFFMEAYARPPSLRESATCIAYLQGEVPNDTDSFRAEHARLKTKLALWTQNRAAVIAPIRAKLQVQVDQKNTAAAKGQKLIDLKPIGRWDFDNGGHDSIGKMHGKLVGKAKVKNGKLILTGGYMMTPPVPKNLAEKSLEVFVQLDPLNQRGGGAMTIQTLNGGTFDSIVFAEANAGQWLAGSNNFVRTASLDGPQERLGSERPVRITLVYHTGGRIEAYRDGVPYGKPIKKGSLQRYGENQAQIIFGLRHGTGSHKGRMLTGQIFEARLYDRALTANEVATAASGTFKEMVTENMLQKALNESQRTKILAMDEQIAQLTNSIDKLNRDIKAQDSARAGTGDPYFRLAHALLNSKELIYVH